MTHEGLTAESATFFQEKPVDLAQRTTARRIPGWRHTSGRAS